MTEKLDPPTSNRNSLCPSVKLYKDSNFCSVFKESPLKIRNASFTPLNSIFSFIVYELDKCLQDLNSDFTLMNLLFGGVKLAENADLNKYV